MDLHKLLYKFYDKRAGILTNQSAYSAWGYHFEYFQKYIPIEKIFIPEHGLFAELQDQVSGDSLKYNFQNLQTVNLYGDNENSLFVKESDLQDLDLVIFDIRDVGSRYYTFLTSCFYLLKSISEYNKKSSSQSIEILVIDSPNPIGRKVEGTPLDKKYSSFVGVEGVVHRHGLTPAELMNYYNAEFHFDVNIHFIKTGKIYSKKDGLFGWIPPSPNIPQVTTCYVYPGQCLLEGTNLSEGRGTTRPFEIFGAPFIDIQDQRFYKEITFYQKDEFILRPLFFIPTFHKFSNVVCGGYQLIINNKNNFHSLLFTLHFLKIIQEFYPKEFSFRKGVYEFRSNEDAIKLLVGDDFLLDYINGKHSYTVIKDYLTNKEKEWKKKIETFLIY